MSIKNYKKSDGNLVLRYEVLTKTESDAAYLEKTSYEWNKAIAFGSSGFLKIGSFQMYDSNVTIEIEATTNTTFHGTVVIATQNTTASSIGSVHLVKVYDDPSGTIANSLRIVWTNGSRNYDVYFVPQAWSKNLIHIRALGIYGASDICISQTGTPPSTTSGLEPTNVLTTTFAALSHNHDSTYLGKTAKAADADKLDGNDSSYFINTSNIGTQSVAYASNSGNAIFAVNSSKLNDQEASYYLNYNNLSNTPTLGTAASKNTGTGSGNVPVLDTNGKLSTSVIPNSVLNQMEYQGTWNASSSTQLSLTYKKGDYFICATAGGDYAPNAATGKSWAVGDWAVVRSVSGSTVTWDKIDNTDAVASVNGKTGGVILTASDVGAATASHNHDGTYLKLSGGTMTGQLKWNDSTALPRANYGTEAALEYILGIRAFSAGGETLYEKKSEFLSGYATESWVNNKGYTTNTGTVTSVGAGTGLSITGTSTVNPTVNIASGYKLPTTSEWNLAYSKPIIMLEDNSTATAGTWLAKTSLISALADGQIFLYKLTKAGASTTTLNVSCNGTASGAKTVYRVGTTKLSTQYGVGSYIMLYYNGTSFYCINDYDANSYAYVRQYQHGSNAAGTGTLYPILTRYNLTNKNGSYDTAYSRFYTGTYIDTSNGYLYAPKLYSDGNEVLTSITSSMITTALGFTPTANTGTVTQVKVGSTEYNPSSGVVSLPAYPTTLPANGGDADTVDGYDADDFYLASNPNGYTSVTETTVTNWGFTKNAGTVTSVKVGDTSYSPSNGVVSLPAYPTVTHKYMHNITVTYSTSIFVTFSLVTNSSTKLNTYSALTQALYDAGFRGIDTLKPATGQVSASLKTRMVVGVYNSSSSGGKYLYYKYIDLISTSSTTATMNTSVSAASTYINIENATIYDTTEEL